MNKIINIVNQVLTNAPKVKYYANLVIHIVDMLDGVKNWQVENQPLPTETKKK